MTTLKAVRGTRDLLPPETALWNRIEATARSVFARYNLGEIRTPLALTSGAPKIDRSHDLVLVSQANVAA